MTDPASQHGVDDTVALVVLAAGGGTRMRSALPKPLHPVCGRPMVEHVLRSGSAAAPTASLVVVSPGLADLPARLGYADRLTAVVQDPPRGTGDAVLRAFDSGALDAARWILVLYADHPLLDGETVRRFIDGARAEAARVTLLTCVLPDAGAYGRVAHDAAGAITGIVERADDDPALRSGPTEIWSGMMVLDAAWARAALPRVGTSAATGEVYLTGLIGLAAEDPGAGPPVVAVQAPPEVADGVNDRVQLARAEAILRQRTRERWMRAGVTMVDPDTVYIDDDAAIGQDTVIHPFCHILAGTTIGERCTIGPHATISGSTIHDRVTVRASTVTDSAIEAGSDVGPYSHVRGGTRIGPGVHVGNFAELKNARLAEGVKVGHVGYLGDATVGERANIGAGTITANYDGRDKHPTTIGARAFIGSDTILRAPVSVGDDAVVGAGSVVTRDVPDRTMVVGVPARPRDRGATGEPT